MCVRRKVWLVRKHVAEIRCNRIEEVVRTKSKNPVDGLVDAHDAGVLVAHIPTLRIRGDRKYKAALAIDVIGFSTLAVMLVTAFTVEAVCRWRLRHEA